MKQTIILTVALVGLALLLAPVAANAGGKKGPRASVSVATVCDVVGSDLTVELRVRDKTSGVGTAEVRAWEIQALAKNARGRWTEDMEFESLSDSGLHLHVPKEGYLSIGPKSFSLCGDGHIADVILEAMALNAFTSTTYGLVDLTENRTIMNRCSDDPFTEGVVEPSGIKFAGALLQAIDTACAAP